MVPPPINRSFLLKPSSGGKAHRKKNARLNSVQIRDTTLIVIGAVTLMFPIRVSAGQGSLELTSQAPSESSKSIQWSFRVGSAYRHLGGINFSSGAYSPSALLPTLQPILGIGRAGSLESLGAGTPDAFANRTYLDGFVFMDGSTANPTSFLPGTTGYWGYQSENQVRNGSLYFSSGEYATSSTQGSSSYNPSGWSSGTEGASPVLELEGVIALDDHWKVGGMVSFLFISADSAHSSSSFRAFQSLSESSFSVTDRYDLQGVIPPLAPYGGTLNPAGPVPVIDNIPTERIVTPTGDSIQIANFSNEVSEAIKIRLYTLSLGPTVHYETSRLVFSGGMGLAINIADWEATFDERLNQNIGGTNTELRRWRARAGKKEVIPGFYLQGSVGYQITNNWQISTFGRYDWSEALSGRVGPSNFSVDLSGYTIGGVVTFTF